MKKFLEKNQLIHFTLVLTIVAIVCGLVIGGVNALTAPIIAENEKQATLVAYEAVMPNLGDFESLDTTNDSSSIVEKVLAKDADGNEIGYIFKTYAANGYGDMTMVLGVALDGTITGAEFLTLNQTLHLDYTRANLQLFVGTNIVDLTPSGDLQSGATHSKESTLIMLEAISESYQALVNTSAISNVEVAYFDGLKGVDSLWKNNHSY